MCQTRVAREKSTEDARFTTRSIRESGRSPPRAIRRCADEGGCIGPQTTDKDGADNDRTGTDNDRREATKRGRGKGRNTPRGEDNIVWARRGAARMALRVALERANRGEVSSEATQRAPQVNRQAAALCAARCGARAPRRASSEQLRLIEMLRQSARASCGALRCVALALRSAPRTALI